MSLLTKIAGDFNILKSVSTKTISSDIDTSSETILVSPLVSSYEPEVLKATAEEDSGIDVGGSTDFGFGGSDTSLSDSSPSFTLDFTIESLEDMFGSPVEDVPEDIASPFSDSSEEAVEASFARASEEEERTLLSDSTDEDPIEIGTSDDSDSDGLGFSFDFVGTSSGTLGFTEETEETLKSTTSPLSLGVEEKNTGVKLKKKEKPLFVAILGEDVSKSGYPRRNTLFFKKINSKRFFMKKIEVFRKNVFSSQNYRRIAILESSDFNVDRKYLKLVENRFPYSAQQLISYTDISLSPDKVYAYKIRVDYDTLTEEQQKQNEARQRIADFASSIGFLG